LEFDKRCKDVEGRYTERLNDMRKQLDTRWKQIDRFEASVKTYADTKASWKRKFTAKDGELEAVKVCDSPFYCCFVDLTLATSPPTRKWPLSSLV
jgi:hypothetical protein